MNAATEARHAPRKPGQGKSVRDRRLVRGDGRAENESRIGRHFLGLIEIGRSPLARKIILFNLLALLMLAAGLLSLGPASHAMYQQRELVLGHESRLASTAFVAQLLQKPDARFGLGLDAATTLRAINLGPGREAIVFDGEQRILAAVTDERGWQSTGLTEIDIADRQSLFADTFDHVFAPLDLSNVGTGAGNISPYDVQEPRDRIDTFTATRHLPDGRVIATALSPIVHQGRVMGAVGVVSDAGDIERLVRADRVKGIRVVAIAILVSIGLSLVLAWRIAHPLSDLAVAAEIGRDNDSRTARQSRVRIPDLTARPDEIGRLSGALRAMVAALHDRIDSNEQFAADVAHEIKNPLASLRSAVGSLHRVKDDDARGTLLKVIDHDVRRLDRLVSDISNASRLDSELVKEHEAQFNLLPTLVNLSDYLSHGAEEQGVDLIADLPADPILIDGLESRLAQVFVNLITNAISFCKKGDTIRIWARRRENRALVVIEDTGPGIPGCAVNKIFNRFYSERPDDQFGNHSGLGLAIAKQIVEAHGGVIWAENIRPVGAEGDAMPLGARFVVGLPV